MLFRSPFYINQTEIIPFRVFHGKLPILGYRIGKMAYITDMLTMEDAAYQYLEDLDVLVINALRITPHPTHQDLQEAINVAKKIGAEKTYFIHMSHHIGLHDKVQQTLPENMYLSWDGLSIEV